MKKTLVLIFPLLFCLPMHARAQTAAPTPAVKTTVAVEAAKPLPEEVTGRELRDLSGRAFRLKELSGRVYVVNLWATWCGPCRWEIPGLNKVYEEYRARGVEFVGLTAQDPEDDAESVREFVNEFRMSYRIGWIDKETVLRLTAWNASGPPRAGSFAIPQTFVVAADGHVVLRVRGYNPRVPEMIRAGIRKALEESPAPAPTPAPPPAAAGRP
ncbi:MAG TPA: TlpA disulfide reductase family protein [Pyrinomonadaceae bacterium]|nr:TlpA disulfide reductase family protein [Pyrinomonadaceae bacterium]